MILIDTPRRVRFRHFGWTSHMMSDLPDPGEARQELDSFAKKLGLRAAWIQKPGTETEHYDLFDGAIERALQSGAVKVQGTDLIERVVRPRRALLKSRGEKA